jgi:hypothetical protein
MVLQVTLTLQPDGVVAPALQAIQASLEVISFCLAALDKEDLSKPTQLDSAGFEMRFQGPNLDADQRKQLYTNWLLAKGFQDLARGMRRSLEEAAVYVAVVSAAKQGLFEGIKTYGDLQTKVQEFRTGAEKSSFPDLMDRVNRRLSSPLNFENEFRSLQKVRNCLEHRAGVVGEADTDKQTGVLRLLLPRAKFFIKKDEQEIEIKPGLTVEADSNIYVKYIVDTREYALGERVTFKANEFHDICFGCWSVANDLGSRLPKLETPVKSTN